MQQARPFRVSGARVKPDRRTPLRTIDDLERREHEALASERDAVLAISALLRELAVRLPDESTLIRRFAEQARSLDIQARGRYVATFCGSSLDGFVHDLVEHFEAGALADES
jgi:hypothetical protein